MEITDIITGFGGYRGFVVIVAGVITEVAWFLQRL